MTLRRMCEQETVDYIGEKTQYWDEVASLAERILSSDSPTEILADFVTKLAFNEVDTDSVDPMEILQSVSADWGLSVTEEDDEYEEVA